MAKYLHWRQLFVFALIAAVTTPALNQFLSARKTIPPSIICHETRPNPSVRIVVLGESWASGGRIMPGFPLEISKRLGRPVRVCEIGYSGLTTEQQRASFERDFPARAIERLLHGRVRSVVLLTGVNDVVQHVGADTYARSVQMLTRELLSMAPAVSVIEVPTINVRPTGSLASYVKRSLFRILNDGTERDVIDRYRSALISLQLRNVSVIDYDRFADSFEEDPASYDQSGLHLTRERFAEYGVYLGKTIAL